MTNIDKGIRLEKENYAIEIKYSEEAIQNKLIKFITKGGEELVFSADEMVSILVNQVNADTLSAAFVETDRINVVEVMRQIKCVLDKDYKKGEEIRINYAHAYPIEFALIEEAYRFAKINEDIPAITLTKEFLDSVKEKIRPEMEKYVQRFYEGFKTLKK